MGAPVAWSAADPTHATEVSSPAWRVVHPVIHELRFPMGMACGDHGLCLTDPAGCVHSETRRRDTYTVAEARRCCRPGDRRPRAPARARVLDRPSRPLTPPRR